MRSLRRRADLHVAGFEADELKRFRPGVFLRLFFSVNREKRVQRKQVQHIRDDQFLVLLLVVQAQFDGRQRFRGQGLASEQRPHPFVHMRPVAQDLFQPGTCQQSAPRPCILLAERVVVGVEQVAK